MLQKSYPYNLANKPVYANEDLKVTDKYSGEVATVVALADASTIDVAIGAADASFEAMKKMPPYHRQEILNHCVHRFGGIFFMVKDVRSVMHSDGIIALDNGVYKIWFARNYMAQEPNTVLLDNALATIYGQPDPASHCRGQKHLCGCKHDRKSQESVITDRRRRQPQADPDHADGHD